MNNNRKYFIQSTSYSTANMMIAGSVIQGFMLESGIAENAVALYLSLVQILQVSVILVVSLVIDKIRNVIRAFAWSMVLQSILFLSLIFLCIFQNVPLTSKYILVFASGILTNVFLAVFNVLTYKVPYHIIDMSNYAQLTGLIGVVVGIGCIAVSAAMSFFTAHFPYYPTMLGFFIFGTAMLFVSFLLTLSYIPVEQSLPKAKKEESKKEKKNLFRYRPFTLLIIPNLLRGFCAGILIVAMTIGHIEGITNPASGAVLTLLLQIGNVLSCLVYAVLAKQISNSSMILISSLALLGFMPAMLVKHSLFLFYGMYFFANFFLNVINNAVPVAVTKFVDYEYVGQYSSWRMLLHTAGIALSNALVTPILGAIGGTSTLLVAAICQLLSGIAYFLFLRVGRERPL